MKVKFLIKHCGACRHWTGGSFQLSPMPALPLVRVTEVSPFLHSGVDYFGPIFIKNERNEAVKAYVALFTCLVTRAIHLEVACNLSGSEFLNCLSRFADRRGTPRFLISDNAKNFTFIQPLVGKKVEISDYLLRQYVTSNYIDWKFIPVYSPWQGGAYERLIGNVKTALKKSYGLSFLDIIEFQTVLCKIKNTVNGRPLTYVSSDEILRPLTPNNFLKLQPSNTDSTLELLDEPLPSNKKTLLIGWQRIVSVLESFWSTFRSKYLTSLREKHSAHHKTTRGSLPFVPKVGQIVLIREPSASRAEWLLRKITNLDNRKAIAHVRQGNRTLIRSINLLSPLEILDNVQLPSKGGSPIKKSRHAELLI